MLKEGGCLTSSNLLANYPNRYPNLNILNIRCDRRDKTNNQGSCISIVVHSKKNGSVK